MYKKFYRITRIGVRMKKKILSLFIIGALFAGMGLSAECFAAPLHRGDGQHREVKHKPHKPIKKAPSKSIKHSPKKHKHNVKKTSHKQSLKNRYKAKFKAQKEHRKSVKQAHKKQKKAYKSNRHNKKQTHRNPFRRR